VKFPVVYRALVDVVNGWLRNYEQHCCKSSIQLTLSAVYSKTPDILREFHVTRAVTEFDTLDILPVSGSRKPAAGAAGLTLKRNLRQSKGDMSLQSGCWR
jgi:hypothetical protein